MYSRRNDSPLRDHASRRSRSRPAPRKREDYRVGIICALPVEEQSMTAMLDEEHPKLPGVGGRDGNRYVCGNISDHDVVIACLSRGRVGKSEATRLAADMDHTFPALDVVLMVGIGGGAPSSTVDIRLGDIAVSVPSEQHPGVVEWDRGKAERDGFRMTGSQVPPPRRLIQVTQEMQNRELYEGSSLLRTIEDAGRRHPRLLASHFTAPDAKDDVLFQPHYMHENHKDCSWCDHDKTTIRPRRDIEEPLVFYGNIACGDQVVKNATERDRIAKEHHIICFEMEAAGIVSVFENRYLVIRGICDYADSHKNKKWQPWAASAAAAYAKAFLRILESTERSRGRHPHFNVDLSKVQDEGDDNPRGRHPSNGVLDLDPPLASLDWTKMSIASRLALIKNVMLRSILHQLIDTLDGQMLLYYLELIYPRCIIQKCELGDLEWTQDVLENDLKDLITNKNYHKQTYLLVDAVDEAAHSIETYRTVRRIFFGQKWVPTDSDATVHVCVACRPWPDVITEYDFLITVDRSNEHDIRLTMDRELEELIVTEKERNTLQERIEQKASGIMQWVLLVCRRLTSSKDLLESQGVDGLLRIIDDVPAELSSVYSQIVDQIPRADVDQFQLIMQWICYARTPLTARQLREAIEVGVAGSHTFKTSEPSAADLRVHDRRALEKVKRLTKGLVESSESEAGTIVQFVHYSVREFLVKDGLKSLKSRESGSKKLIKEIESDTGSLSSSSSNDTIHNNNDSSYLTISEERSSETSQDAHLMLVEVCVSLLSHRFIKATTTTRVLDDKPLEEYPLLEYAVTHWLDHFYRLHNSWRLQERIDIILDKIDRPSFMRSWVRLDHIRCRQKNIRPKHDIGTTFLDLCVMEGFDEWIPSRYDLVGTTSYKHNPFSTSGFTMSPYVVTKALIAATTHTHWWKSPLLDLLSVASFQEVRRSLSLGIAANGGHIVAVRMLLRLGAEVDTADYYGRSPLYLASRRGYANVVELLLDHDADASATPIHGWSPLGIAAFRRQWHVYDLLLQRGAKPNQKDVNEVLYQAALTGKTEYLKQALELGADTAALYQGETALHAAAHCGHDECVQLLYDFGTDINARGRLGATPIQTALLGKRSTTFRLLLNVGADLTTTDEEDWTTLAHAMYKKDMAAMKSLLDAGSDPNALVTWAENKAKMPLLSWAILEEVPILYIRILVDAGADVNGHSPSSYTPLGSAMYLRRKTVVGLLLERGADVNRECYHPRMDSKSFKLLLPPLTLALIQRCLESAALLKDRGAEASSIGRLTSIWAFAAGLFGTDMEDAHSDDSSAEGSSDESESSTGASGNSYYSPTSYSDSGDEEMVGDIDEYDEKKFGLDFFNSLKELVEFEEEPRLLAYACHAPCEKDLVHYIEPLIALGASPNVLDALGWPPLGWAVAHGAHKTFDALIANGADVDVRVPEIPLFGLSPRDADDLFAIIDQLSEPANHQPASITLLHVAAGFGQADMVTKLLELGLDPYRQDLNGCTPACHASKAGHSMVVGQLLEHMPSWSCPFGKHFSAMCEAAAAGDIQMLQSWRSRSNDPDLNSGGGTALYLGASKGHLDVVTYMLRRTNTTRSLPGYKKVADISGGLGSPMTPLTAAVRAGRIDVVKHLLEQGAKKKKALPRTWPWVLEKEPTRAMLFYLEQTKVKEGRRTSRDDNGRTDSHQIIYKANATGI
ncbi:Ankyrin repeat-containing protein 16 [Elsinoe fawcettii]|nr:Ankyrin repeat-containing protein 16 [Elsinoe fawcettii]